VSGDWESAETHELATALAKAQCVLATVGKSREAHIASAKGNYKYTYATLADCWAAWRAAGPPNGLAIVQRLMPAECGYELETKLVHTSGQWMRTLWVMPPRDTPQAMGSEITYARRYSLCALVGIVSDEEDDNGGAAEEDAKQHPEPRREAPTQVTAPTTAVATASSPVSGPTGDAERKAAELIRAAKTRRDLGLAGVEVAKLGLPPESRARVQELYSELKAGLTS